MRYSAAALLLLLWAGTTKYSDGREGFHEDVFGIFKTFPYLWFVKIFVTRWLREGFFMRPYHVLNQTNGEVVDNFQQFQKKVKKILVNKLRWALGK